MDNISSNYVKNEENPRKRVRHCLKQINRDEETPAEEEDRLFVKPNTTDIENVDNGLEKAEFAFNVSLEEDEKLLNDSETDVNYSHCKTTLNDKKNFEIRRVRGFSRINRDEGSSITKDGAERTENDTNSCFKHSQCRGEMPELNEIEECGLENETFVMDTSEVSGESEGKQNPEPSRDDIVKKTPERSLFKKVHEKLLYECNLTPKKVKKKCLELNLDL